MQSIIEAIHQSGYAVVKGVFGRDILTQLLDLCEHSPARHQSKRRGKSLYGARHLLNSSPQLREMLSETPFIELARAIQGDAARPVKCVYFDKTVDANWLVPWHQDVTITVQERRDVAGFEMRPVKDGIVHVLPPVKVSEQLLALRIHLDDAGPDHGALRVIPGSHRHGRLNPTQISEWIASTAEDVVAVEAGDVMLMKPLLLHASSPCQQPEHRRVIHVEFAASDLPGGLEWAG